MTFPNVKKVAEANGGPAYTVRSVSELKGLQKTLDTPVPVLYDVWLDTRQGFEPRLRSRIGADGKIVTPNLEDTFPFLSPEELLENMLVGNDG